jgi:CCR4-NOT complex subunit CAF16
VLQSMNLSLPAGSRTILVGDNGAGKSTLLRILSGKHMHPEESVVVLGKPSFFDTSLNERRAYLGTDWGRRTVAFSGHNMPLMADIGVDEMMLSLQNEFKERRDELVELLGIDMSWRMHQLSDGQRRRVQIMLQLLRPVELLLLDEITTDLDCITRQDFLNHLCVMSKRDGTTIVYATHIFDGLDDWPTHIAYLADGALRSFGLSSELGELNARRLAGTPAPLLRTIEGWMRAHREEKKAAGRKLTEAPGGGAVDELRGALTGNGYLSGRMSGGFN